MAVPTCWRVAIWARLGLGKDEGVTCHSRIIALAIRDEKRRWALQLRRGRVSPA